MKKTLLCLWITLASSTMAWAAPQARLVVDLQGNSDVDAVLEHLRGAFGERFDARVASVDEALDQGFGAWSVLAPAEVGPCAADPVTLEQIQATLVEAEALMQSLEYTPALEMLEALDGTLCGISEPIPAELLARVPFLRGVIHYYAEQPAAAREAFRVAVLRQPELEWDATFPPDPQQVFLGGVADAYRADRVVLEIDAQDRPPRLIVNGVELDSGTTEVELLGAEHMIQAGAGDTVATVLLQTGEATRVHLVGPGYVADGLAQPMDSDQGAAAFTVLAAAAEGAGYREVVVLAQPLAEQAWLYDDIDRVWTSVSLVLSKKLAEGRKVASIGGALVGAGSAVAVAGAVIGLRNYTSGVVLQRDMLSDPGLYDHHLEEYETLQVGSGVGYVMLGVGASLVGVGIPLLIRGQAIQKGALTEPKVALTPMDGGVAFGLSGGF